ncbi:hypothetical protein BV20DRAFT_1053254 [Pilatotrama ljubarskyi]|nr:hypothetical protein BV20DRAFT_1053254 [Pilatotrama ljubarskyi]
MSPSSASSSSLSSSPASSLASAPSAWSPLLPHMNGTKTASTLPPVQRHVQAAPQIASLPSLAHSLSSFPTMTVVTNDMVHYGTLGRTKGASEAKLNSALSKAKQRQDAGPGAMMSVSSASARARYPTPEDDDPVLLIVPKRSKAKRSS